VYASHGAGRVAAREKRTHHGTRQEVIVLALADGLSVELSIKRAQELLRPLASEADISRVQAALRGDRVVSADPWLSRRRDAQAKLKEGGPVELAEIIRDGAQRESTLAAARKGGKAQVSQTEKEHVRKARQLLASEIALARRLELAEAEAWIETQLESAG
jgi:CarD family transcriptional regulator